MFDDGKSRDALREVDPPKQVVVTLARVWPAGRTRWATDTPIWARAGGVDVTAPVAGLLHAWVLTSVGRWWPWVRFTVRSANGELELEVDQLVPVEAVRLAE